MELQAPLGILLDDAVMTGQGKGMPGMAAFGADDDTNDPGNAGSASGAGTPSGGNATPEGAAGGVPQGDVFDLWLRAELSRLYDTTLAEPVPPDMLRLLNGAKKG
jgi:hypothetical protein